MTKSEHIRRFVVAHPGCTNKDIAAALGYDEGSVASITSYSLRTTKQLSAKIARYNPTGSPVFGFYPFDPTLAIPASQIRRKLVKPAKAPPKSSENVPTTHENVLVKKRETKSSPNGLEFIETLVTQIADSIAGSIAARLKEVLPGKVQELLPQAPLAPEAKAPLIKDMRKKVMVVGLLPVQNAELVAEFGNTFDLRFFGSDEIKAAKAAAMYCERVFYHTRHGGHAMDEALQIAGNMTRVKGGLSAMREALKEFYDHA